MPLYEYRCTQCGYRFEKIQAFDAAPETECPKCHGVLKRPLTAPALQFKGSGWYVNDYAPKGTSGSAEGDSSSSSKAEAGESKPAASGSTAKPAASEPSSKPSGTESASKPSSSTTAS